MCIQCLQNSVLSMIKHSIVCFTFEEKENIPNKLRTVCIHTAFPPSSEIRMTQTLLHVLKHGKKTAEGKSMKFVPQQTKKIKQTTWQTQEIKNSGKEMNCLNGISSSFRINTYLKNIFSLRNKSVKLLKQTVKKEVDSVFPDFKTRRVDALLQNRF